MRNNRKQPHGTLGGTIVYWAFYLPILAVAIVSIPFGRQNSMAEKDELERQMQTYEATAITQREDISNLKIKLEFFKGEHIKQHAQRLGLKRPSPDQIVYLDRPAQDNYLEQSPQAVPQHPHFQTATAANDTSFTHP